MIGDDDSKPAIDADLGVLGRLNALYRQRDLDELSDLIPRASPSSSGRQSGGRVPSPTRLWTGHFTYYEQIRPLTPRGWHDKGLPSEILESFLIS